MKLDTLPLPLKLLTALLVLVPAMMVAYLLGTTAAGPSAALPSHLAVGQTDPVSHAAEQQAAFRRHEEALTPASVPATAASAPTMAAPPVTGPTPASSPTPRRPMTSPTTVRVAAPSAPQTAAVSPPPTHAPEPHAPAAHAPEPHAPEPHAAAPRQVVIPVRESPHAGGSGTQHEDGHAEHDSH